MSRVYILWHWSLPFLSWMWIWEVDHHHLWGETVLQKYHITSLSVNYRSHLVCGTFYLNLGELLAIVSLAVEAMKCELGVTVSWVNGADWPPAASFTMYAFGDKFLKLWCHSPIQDFYSFCFVISNGVL